MAENRTNFGLLIQLRRSGGEPLHRQIEASLRAGIRSGRLRLGTALPPTRTLAADLGVSRGVVVEAYQQLTAEGYLTSRSGGYTQVAVDPQTTPRDTSRPAAARAPRVDFGYGRADVAGFPRAAWLRSYRKVLVDAPNERFGYPSGRGVPELRVALADYLNRVRGTTATPENVVICTGYAQGVTLLIQTLARAGAKVLAVEDPSADDDARPAAVDAGLDVIGVPVDDNGLRIDALDQVHADALVLTPSHQWPTGGVLPAASRAAVLAWASRRNAVVVEDDYDAEYRYDRTPIGAMQGLAPDQVVYAGSASKTMAPALRLGWLVVPNHLVDAVAEAKITADRGSSVLDQLAFAEFLSRGEFDRHLRRMRPQYRRRRDALLAALRTRLPDFEPTGVAAGLHLVTWLPPDLDEAAVVAAAAERGLGVGGVAPYHLTPDQRGGLIFGYATLNERAIAEGIDILAATCASLRRGQSPA